MSTIYPSYSANISPNVPVINSIQCFGETAISFSAPAQ
jgi:hypothetical protein